MEQNKVRTYLLYAFGEILLVVIGILIALQINNWNEERKVIQEEKRLLTNVLQALEADSIAYVLSINLVNNTKEVYDRIYKISRNELVADSLTDTYLMRRSIPGRPISIVNYPNLASQVVDPVVKEAALEYYGIAYKWNFVVNNYNDFIETNMRPFLGEKGLLNYNYHHQQILDRQELLNDDLLISLLDQTDTQQMLFEATVKTQNLNGFYERVLDSRRALIKEIIRVIN